MTMKPPLSIDDLCDDDMPFDIKVFRDHVELAGRLRKTLYYGRQPIKDRTSFPMTGIAVELFAKAVPEGLGEINMDYAATVSRNACISPCSMILALVYLKRLQKRDPDYLRHVSSSDLFLVSMLVASKFLYDEGEEEDVFNDEWATYGSLDIKEINLLERKFLAAMDWQVFVSSSMFAAALHDMELRIAWQAGIQRGWFSYTDMAVLTENIKTFEYWNLIKENIFKVAVVCSVAYILSITSIIGACLVVSHLKLPQRLQPDYVGQSLSNVPVIDTLENNSGMHHVTLALHNFHSYSADDLEITGFQQQPLSEESFLVKNIDTSISSYLERRFNGINQSPPYPEKARTRPYCNHSHSGISSGFYPSFSSSGLTADASTRKSTLPHHVTSVLVTNSQGENDTYSQPFLKSRCTICLSSASVFR